MRISPVPLDSQLAHQMLPSDNHDRVTPVYLTRLTEETFWCLQNFTYIPVADEAQKSRPLRDRTASRGGGAEVRTRIGDEIGMENCFGTRFC
jgi:hypothetical protein